MTTAFTQTSLLPIVDSVPTVAPLRPLPRLASAPLLLGILCLVAVGCTSDVVPREIIFRNRSNAVIWVEGMTGLETSFKLGPLAPGATHLVQMRSPLPKRITIKWQTTSEKDLGNPSRTTEIDVSLLKCSHANDALGFRFLPNETWMAAFETEAEFLESLPIRKLPAKTAP